MNSFEKFWKQLNESDVCVDGEACQKEEKIEESGEHKKLEEGKIVTSYCYYNKDDELVYSEDTMQALADDLGITASAVARAIKRGSDRIVKVQYDEDDEFLDLIMPEDREKKLTDSER